MTHANKCRFITEMMILRTVGETKVRADQMDDNKLGNSRIDYLTSFGRSLVGWAPFVGPALSDAVTILIPNQRLDRMQDFVSKLDARLKHLEQNDLRSCVEAHLNLLEEGFVKAARAATADRRSSIANLVSKGITSTTPSETEIIFLLDLLDQVNDAEIIQLGYFIQPNVTAINAYESKYADIVAESFVPSGPNQGAARARKTFQTAYKIHLARVGLLEEQISTMYDGSQKVEGYKITDLGRLLLECVDFKW